MENQDLTIRAIQREDNEEVFNLIYYESWNFKAKRIAFDFVKSKGFIAVQVIAVAIVTSTTCIRFYEALCIIGFMFPFLFYTLFPVIMYTYRSYTDPSLRDLQTDIYQHWSRPSRPDMKLWVAVIHSQVVGCIAVSPSTHMSIPSDPNQKTSNSNNALLMRLAVKTEYRGHSIGKRLVAHAIEFSRQQGFRQMFLSTSKHQPEAQKLFECFGFKLRKSCSMFFGLSQYLEYKLIL